MALMNNSLSGGLPMSLCDRLRNLNQVLLSDNKLNGVLPLELSYLNHLEVFSLNTNSLSGSLPVGIFNISSLSIISLEFNNLSGTLPSNMCGELSTLEELYLEDNNFTGHILNTILNCSNLINIDLSDNHFVGSIPNDLGNLRLLKFLNLGDNYFTSESPSLELEFMNSLSNCKDLELLDVHGNLLGGYLPKSVGNLSASLEQFFAANSSIRGEIPMEFGNLRSLITLDLQRNHLTGSIPETFKGLKALQKLILNDNELSGAMLDKLCGLPRLGGLYLNGNKILEPIPKCLGNVTSLRYLVLHSNRLHSSIPSSLWNMKNLLILTLSENLLTGSLPLEVGNLKAASGLDFSKNNLSHEIPHTIGGLQNLEYLSLAFNEFQGTIPESVGGMVGLKTLDLSHNNLSGTIPMTLEKLRYLKYFNVSFNHLIGEIPSHGPFQNFTSESFISNKDLCGDQKFHVPPCPKTSYPEVRGQKRSKVLFALLSVAVVVGIIAFIGIYIRFLRKGKIHVPGLSNALFDASLVRFSYYQLAHATNGFDESNLLGKGSFASVYKGITNEGTIFAIKVFNPEMQEAFKSFDRECEMLRNLRHRNLTKVISSCSTPDFKAIILEFMPNGSLDKWLYSHNYSLSLIQRLNIMIDVAIALEYLHNEHLTPVVHCDLKPSNILLDLDMVAHVTDFSISKFLSKEDCVIHTQTIATFGYVAPEYGTEGLVSTRCDVYSYGIIMMELFTRTKPNDDMFDGNFNLRTWVNDAMASELATVLDANILNRDDVNFNEKLQSLYSIMEVALNCTKDQPGERRNIKEILDALNKIKVKILTYHAQ
ncbi:OLC1v1001486C1 [Oldenlandia corymbosa var. corymbosa]|uniref:non-specific serine/threonine protein kinase n=1 Tax=Oldenlandia corymbosa var. corymbosa TaxID=529605 RepID=A0AAV1D631_OLDCO|nr:OLC1v1001486C1 [Oldenlandia corymbosa var. corymbosa]